MDFLLQQDSKFLAAVSSKPLQPAASSTDMEAFVVV